ncbi:hypothetical protein [Yoonia sp.]|uniref:hypothetical protein n=1 Tax=Yoonia sp. TaxID=2212373 RepID=UPI00391B998C
MAQNDKIMITRRNLLAKLGLATGAAYVAPTLMGMDTASASTGSGASRPSRPSSPSRPSRPSRTGGRTSRPSGPSRSRNAADERAFQWRWDATTMRWVRSTSAP